MHHLPELLNRRWSESEINNRNSTLSMLHAHDFNALSNLMGQSIPLHIHYAEQLLFAQSQKLRVGYQPFTQKKSNGRQRILYIPPLALKHVQRHIHQWLTTVYTPHPSAHGFVPGGSIQRHAQVHAGQRRVLSIDIQQCFNSTTHLHLMDSLNTHIKGMTTPALRALIHLCTNAPDTSICDSMPQTKQIQRACGLAAPIIEYLQGHPKELWLETLIEFAYDPKDAGRLSLHFPQKEREPLRQYAEKLQENTPLSFRKCFYVRLLLIAKQRIRQIAKQRPDKAPKTLSAALNIAESMLGISAIRRPCHTTLFLDSRIAVLPQGSPASPMLSNICLHELDNHCQQYANKHHLKYSRYADDLCFSGQHIPRRTPAWIAKILETQAFRIHRHKIRHQGAATQQRITGLVVNAAKNCDSVRIDRKYYRKLKAALHNMDCGRVAYGPLRTKGASTALSPAQVLGHLAFVHSVSPMQYHKLVARSPWAQKQVCS